MADTNQSSAPTRAGHSGRTSPAAEPSSNTDTSPQAPAGRATVDEASLSQAGVEHQDSKEPLEEYAWEKLEDRFSEKMDERQAAETAIYKEFNTLLAVRCIEGCLNNLWS